MPSVVVFELSGQGKKRNSKRNCNQGAGTIRCPFDADCNQQWQRQKMGRKPHWITHILICIAQALFPEFLESTMRIHWYCHFIAVAAKMATPPERKLNCQFIEQNIFFGKTH